MKAKYLMALDQGTTSSRCIIFDRLGQARAVAQQEIKQIYPRAGWVEHDPMDILRSQIFVMKKALAMARLQPGDIDSIGIANQRETVVVWDRHGVPICNAIVWQCRRTSEYCASLKTEGFGEMIYNKTGLEPDPYFSASKLRWILDNIPSARQRATNGELLFGTIDSFLLWHLTGGKHHCTDHTNASRTMLFNIHTMEWDEELLQLFDIPRCMLPTVKRSSDDYGSLAESFFGEQIPIRSLVGDQQAALFGQLCVSKGDIKNTYGTGCFMLLNCGSQAVRSRHGLLTTLAATYQNSTDYALEGSVFIGGAVVRWLRDNLGVISTAAESENAALSVEDTGGVYFVPSFVGLGAPYWDSEVRGLIVGLTGGTRKEHIIRSALESIAYQVGDIFHAMERDLGSQITALNVDGGASANGFLLQFQADILEADVTRPTVIETTALGAAYLAGLHSGFYKTLGEIIKQKAANCTVFSPKMPKTQRKRLLDGWKRAVDRARIK